MKSRSKNVKSGPAPSRNGPSTSFRSVSNSKPSHRHAETVPSKATPRRSNQPTTPPTRRRNRKTTVPRKKRKNNVLREIRYLQFSNHTLIAKAPFVRVIYEILQEFSNDFRVTKESLSCLQEATEIYLTQLFDDANRCTIHRNKATLMVKDLELVRRLRGPNDPGND